MKRLLMLLVAVPALVVAQDPVKPAAREAKPAAEPAAAERVPAADKAPAAEAATAPAARAAAKASGDIAVAAAKVGTAVEERELSGEATSFPATVGKVYCWTKVTGGAGEEITHAWYHEGKVTSEVKLALKFPSVRTYSSKTIPPEMKGAWRVDVLGPDGAVLKSIEFKVE